VVLDPQIFDHSLSAGDIQPVALKIQKNHSGSTFVRNEEVIFVS
jgi:hypothetical protein